MKETYNKTNIYYSLCNWVLFEAKSLFVFLIKDQLISKGLVDFFNSSKKRMKNFCLGQKSKLSSSFFGRIEDKKIFFQD